MALYSYGPIKLWRYIVMALPVFQDVSVTTNLSTGCDFASTSSRGERTAAFTGLYSYGLYSYGLYSYGL